jgi:DNA repair protein RadC
MENENPVLSNDESIIESAIKILESRISYSSSSTPLTSPQASKDYVKLQLATYEHEVFACLFLDNKHRVITFEKLFRGSINSASVYPREVVKACLKHNAAAVILAHNHPSGVSEPSQADLSITSRLSDALALIDVRILDHLIVGEDVTSFAERGLI